MFLRSLLLLQLPSTYAIDILMMSNLFQIFVWTKSKSEHRYKTLHPAEAFPFYLCCWDFPVINLLGLWKCGCKIHIKTILLNCAISQVKKQSKLHHLHNCSCSCTCHHYIIVYTPPLQLIVCNLIPPLLTLHFDCNKAHVLSNCNGNPISNIVRNNLSSPTKTQLPWWN